MDFSRQCRRFQNFRLLNEDTFRRQLTNIAAISTFKNASKTSTQYRIVLADNDERMLLIVNESDGALLKELHIDYETYGICCTSKPNNNFIYVSDYTNGCVRKYDETLNELVKLTMPDKLAPMRSPCQLAINSELELIQVVDQMNCRLVCFDLNTDAYASDFRLFDDDLTKVTKFSPPNRVDLSKHMSLDEHHGHVKRLAALDFWPFGLFSKNERVFVTDWNRGFLYVYKNGVLERKIGNVVNTFDGSNTSTPVSNYNGKLFLKPRDIIIDSLDSILVADTEQNALVLLDHKGVYQFQTKLPKIKSAHAKDRSMMSYNSNGIYGLSRIENNKLLIATNSSIIICNLTN